MAGGASITTAVAATLAEGVALATVSVSTGASGASGVLNSVGITVPTFGPYRDKQQNKPAVYSITVPGAHVSTTNTPNGTPLLADTSGRAAYRLVTNVIQAAPTVYVFDAVMIATHRLRWEATSKPLQSGNNTSDHIIKIQPEITLEIGMSDAMAAYTPGQWIGNPSKSISAWQVLNKIANSRVLVTLATRQATYTNMAIIILESPETNKTVTGLKATVTFKQMLLSSVNTITQTARPNATDSTQLSTVQTTAPSDTLIQSNQVDNSVLPVGNSDSVVGTNGVPAGGQFSSNAVDSDPVPYPAP